MNNIVIALEITGLGMGLVFAAIILLWWVMDLLTLITADKKQASYDRTKADTMEADSTFDRDDIKARVAAVAVAIALAELQASPAHLLSEPPTAIVSAWQLGTRTRQLYEKGTPVVRKPRKIG